MSSSNGVTTSSEETKQFAVCVFCGASPGKLPIFIDSAKALAKALVDNNWSLVYGGGTVGLMGALASTVVQNGGNVHGIIPLPLVRREQGGEPPSEAEFGRTTVVADMHQRKAMMGREADAFVALPGGFGTLEELFEVVTWNQLGIHGCPIVILNINGFYDGLFQWMDKAVECGFISESTRGIVVEAKTVEEVPQLIKSYKPVEGRFNLDWSSQ